MKPIVIISGTQRGFGVHLKSAFSQKYHVLSLVRTKTTAESNETQIEWDFSKTFSEQQESWNHLNVIFKKSELAGCIFNSGVLGPTLTELRGDSQPREQTDSPAIATTYTSAEYWNAYDDALKINFRNPAEFAENLFPYLLSNSTQNEGLERRSVPRFLTHISTGASINPYAGLDAYSASKAAMLSQTKAWSLRIPADQCFIFAFAPGVLDTQMSTQVRQLPSSCFPQKSKFEKIHAENRFTEMPTSAQSLFHITEHSLENREKLQGSFIDVRDMLAK